MIPFDFEYYKPTSVEEAIQLFNDIKSQGKKPIYYGGGTEFISMARMNNIYADAVIDVKGIPECKIHKKTNGNLIIGSAITLTEIAEVNHFPLLTYVVKRIADHTIQDKITLGGNLLGSIIYKESILPLLLSNSKILLQGNSARRTVSIMDIYDQKILLEEDELLIQVITEERFLALPFRHVKRTKHEKIDYPLLTMVAIKDKDKISIAFSGLCEYPIRSIEIEKILNKASISSKNKIKKSMEAIPGDILDDLSGSSEYRKFVLSDMLTRVFEKFEEVN